MEIRKEGGKGVVATKNYTLTCDPSKPLFVDLVFANGLGGEFFVGSGCDRDELIDELVSLSPPELKQGKGEATLTFRGKTTLWPEVEYVFTCREDAVEYGYTVHGQGKIDNARFFEGFLADDPRMKDRYYPYFCGWGRHAAYHRPVKFFMTSSQPKFELLHCFSINSSDTRTVMHYEDMTVRVSGTRTYLGGDWLVTPPAFLYQLGRRGKDAWVNVGLLCKSGENHFMEFQYCGGETVGFNLTYDGYVTVAGKWESPKILFQAVRGDVYAGLEQYCSHLRETGLVKQNAYRKSMPRWWSEPIFGGWGEQMFASRHWPEYRESRSTGWSGGGANSCTRPRYEDMLRRLEAKGVKPTILIVDNRWFHTNNSLEVDEKLWPDMKGWVAEQHAAGRKVILWVSPWEHAHSVCGNDVPLTECLISERKDRYKLLIDTDVFYNACGREKQKVREKIVQIYADENWPAPAYPDPLNSGYEARIRAKIDQLISPDGLNADGFEFDYTHFMPRCRGTVPVDGSHEMIWGNELLHRLLWIYYDQAKKSKSDALIITHTFNPFFDDVVDMLRLQDIYTDRRFISEQMEHRAKLAQAACPGCVIHTDQHPMPSLEAWREYAKFQSTIGNPCLYYVSGIETTHEEFTEADFELLRSTWAEHHRNLDEKFGPRKA